MSEVALAATVVLGRERDAGFEVLMMQRTQRGAFAGAWAFPGGRVDDTDAPGRPRHERARVAAAREVFEEVGLRLDADALVPLSRWMPPARIPRRFDTDFFLAKAADGEIVASADEVAAWRWISPTDAIAAHAGDDFELHPPTFVTLARLAEFRTFDAALQHSLADGPAEFLTQGIPTDGLLVWEGDELADGDVETEHGPRNRLLTDAVPWRYVHRGVG
ncbi:NUDIX hydrolase [uncultured Agrococcus sp.]|uniref:NUDIX hydrolase n=1 Tax=uncultured Agrococcus sp. TaxID=382258 RepID=UPI0025FB4C7E|nr:NUDIX hydrolase [uncultured Agrococcus sp.]